MTAMVYCHEVSWMALTGSTPPPPSHTVTRSPLEGCSSGPCPCADPLGSHQPGVRVACTVQVQQHAPRRVEPVACLPSRRHCELTQSEVRYPFHPSLGERHWRTPEASQARGGTHKTGRGKYG